MHAQYLAIYFCNMSRLLCMHSSHLISVAHAVTIEILTFTEMLQCNHHLAICGKSLEGETFFGFAVNCECFLANEQHTLLLI